METQNKSEKYRKYLIKLKFRDFSAFTIWGTDMDDKESDKLLIIDRKLLLFKTLKNLKDNIANLHHPFLDRENFKKWETEENLNKIYSTYDFTVLCNFNFKWVSNKAKSIEALNCLNLIQDFFLQVNLKEGKRFFSDQLLLDLKDYIYNTYFWQKKETYRILDSMYGFKLETTLRDIYRTFAENSQFFS